MVQDERNGTVSRAQIVRGTPTEEDLAALAGVIPAAYREESTEATADEPVAADLWSTSRRMRRLPGGAWGRFSG